MATMFASTWGNPNSTKRAFLVHGLIGSSVTMRYVAREFASRGWSVTAPDLLGHGQARRGKDYTIAALANELRPYFTPAESNDYPYDVVVGHSLGGVVAAALFPYLKSTRSVHVVLVDPPLEVPFEFHNIARQKFMKDLKNPKSPEEYQQEDSSWSREATIFKSMNVRLCEIPGVEAIMEQNQPWSFSHLLSTVPDNVKLTVLAADPSMPDRCVTEEQLKPYPHVITKVVRGAGHYIQHDFPQVVVDAALEQNVEN
ncbi:Alpha/Beta hydrolase protein [Chiua virens]|nr:Alpha/Beta hydrolase protein [Chiua virens]